MIRWFGSGGRAGTPPPEAQIVQLALRLNLNPEEIENMSQYWFSRLWIYLQAESEYQAEEEKKRNKKMRRR